MRLRKTQNSWQNSSPLRDPLNLKNLTRLELQETIKFQWYLAVIWNMNTFLLLKNYSRNKWRLASKLGLIVIQPSKTPSYVSLVVKMRTCHWKNSDIFGSNKPKLQGYELVNLTGSKMYSLLPVATVTGVFTEVRPVFYHQLSLSCRFLTFLDDYFDAPFLYKWTMWLFLLRSIVPLTAGSLLNGFISIPFHKYIFKWRRF